MSRLTFPSGRRIFENKTFSREFLELTLAEIREAGEFTGFLKSERSEVRMRKTWKTRFNLLRNEGVVLGQPSHNAGPYQIYPAVANMSNAHP